MSSPVVALIIIALGFVALGLQVLSRHIQRTSVDVRRADPLVDVSQTKSKNVRPAELHQLIGIVSNSLISDASRRTELQPILDSLGASAPDYGVSKRRVRPRSKGKRSQEIEGAISELEDRWLVDHDEGRSPS